MRNQALLLDTKNMPGNELTLMAKKRNSNIEANLEPIMRRFGNAYEW